MYLEIFLLFGQSLGVRRKGVVGLRPTGSFGRKRRHSSVQLPELSFHVVSSVDECGSVRADHRLDVSSRWIKLRWTSGNLLLE